MSHAEIIVIQTTKKFNGKIKVLHPVIFINYIKNKSKKQFIRENIEVDATMWFIGKESEPADMQTFESKFFKQFWRIYEQDLIRENLYFGKFNDKMSTNMTNYALKLFIIKDRYLTPALEESEIVQYISRYFKSNNRLNMNSGDYVNRNNNIIEAIILKT